jgi:hypothetical protein
MRKGSEKVSGNQTELETQNQKQERRKNKNEKTLWQEWRAWRRGSR